MSREQSCHLCGLLAGRWEGEETTERSPWDRDSDLMSARLVAHLGRSGDLVITEYLEARSGRVCYEAHGLLGWDSLLGAYLHWRDSQGGFRETTPALGRWHDDTAIFERRGGGCWARFTFLLEGRDAFTFRRECSCDDSPGSPIIEARFRPAPVLERRPLAPPYSWW